MEIHQYSRLADQAACQDDLDSACRLIQDAMGQTDGGLAGIIFSDIGPDDWPDMAYQEKLKRMEEYAKAEFLHQDKMSLSEFDLLLAKGVWK